LLADELLKPTPSLGGCPEKHETTRIPRQILLVVREEAETKIKLEAQKEAENKAKEPTVVVPNFQSEFQPSS
jgi:hypothetical protein